MLQNTVLVMNEGKTQRLFEFSKQSALLSLAMEQYLLTSRIHSRIHSTRDSTCRGVPHSLRNTALLVSLVLVHQLSSCEPFSVVAGGYEFAFLVTRITLTCSEMDITLRKRSKIITPNEQFL
ncbi:hypothetical protein TNCV_2742031 [Trichonephila clavipes]|nr:hypothetical protein TNCV_2742031 [Trichonephila clavipes]